MARKRVVQAFRELAAPRLRSEGFVGRQGHFVRRAGAVTQVVELQHSVYGGRLTANLGLGLEWLCPQLPWVRAPSLGPHAHDCIRWIRLGLVSPARADTWWSYEDSEQSAQDAVHALSEVLLVHGLPWLEIESTEQAFLRYAHDKLERSKSRRHPDGCFPELRLMAAVCAWSEDVEAASRYAGLARELWDEERARLATARSVYARRHPDRESLARVPDLLDELEQLTSTTRGEASFSAEEAARSRRSKSSPSAPSRAGRS